MKHCNGFLNFVYLFTVDIFFLNNASSVKIIYIIIFKIAKKSIFNIRLKIITHLLETPKLFFLQTIIIFILIYDFMCH